MKQKMKQNLKISEEQYAVLEILLHDYENIALQILKHYKLATLHDMQQDSFLPILKKIVNLRDIYKAWERRHGD